MNIVPGVQETLVSGSKLADANYITVLDNKELNIYDGETTQVLPSEKPVLQGYRCRNTGLWRIPLKPVVHNENVDTKLIQCPPKSEAIANVFELPSKAKQIAYYHAAAGFPVKSTWINAVRAGNYSTWQGLTVDTIRKYYPETDATQEGHMHGRRQGIKSTKKRLSEQNASEPKVEPKAKEHDIFIQIVDLQETIYTDQTGKFPYLSSKGNRYVMVAVHIDANYITMEPMKNRTEGQMIETYNRIVAKFKGAGLSMKKHILDNEASEDFKAAIKGHGMTYELVPPGNHRRNIAERAIQTAKNHFTAVLCGTADSFPMHLWCRLLPQSEKQLNMLRQSNVTPKISVYAHVHGPHDFMRHPWAPLGSEMLMHEPAAKRKSWDKHATLTWHLGSSPE
ncbi:hypothetical protein ACHAWF_004304, partial [Thalassiosira exigua]